MGGRSAHRLSTFVSSNFLLSLEYQLSKKFSSIPDDNVRLFWCDGILIEESIYTEFTIETEKQIIAKAWIGGDGQDVYTMVIKLGKCSIESYLNEADMVSHLPEGDISTWLTIQPDNKTIEVRLD
jgi:hypothetical protein